MAAEPSMQGRVRGGSGSSGGRSHDWMEEVNLRITEEADGVHLFLPSYFRRFDAFDNEEHPSIFKPRPRPNQDGAVTAMAPYQRPTSPSQQPLTDPSREQGQLQQAQPTETEDQIVVAAIGPYHQGSAQPPLITYAKKCGIVKYLTQFNLDVINFLGWARNNEERARRCYERESLEISSEEFAKMLLLDGCLLLFAVFLLRPSVREDQRPVDLARDADHGREFNYLSADISFHMKQTRLDLLKLHNQIPFFVLTELHSRLKGTLFNGINHSLEELALSCFQDVHPIGLIHPRMHGHGNSGGDRFPSTVHHLLHLFHWSLVPREKHAVGISSMLPREPESHLPSATELHEESMTVFRKQKKAKGRNLCLDITFESNMLATRGTMRLPSLHIRGYTKAVFRNLISFEQSHLRCGHGVTAYAICMSRLLQTETDAKLLRNNGILPHTQQTDQEIVDFFRQLVDECRDTCVPDDLLKLCNSVAAHHRSMGVRFVKGFVLQCFPKQTVTFFVIFGAIISIATLVHTIHSMYRYYHPFSHLAPVGR
uniref:Uncharacterized protein n=1 Tax=Leersia perrieri TaxID=77586 RepID=A0A0D9XBU3_9ORYZ